MMLTLTAWALSVDIWCIRGSPEPERIRIEATSLHAYFMSIREQQLKNNSIWINLKNYSAKSECM